MPSRAAFAQCGIAFALRLRLVARGSGEFSKMRKILGIVALGAALGGCASSTGILPAGPDTYTLSERFAPVRGGGDEAQRDALTKANEFAFSRDASLCLAIWVKPEI